MGLFCRFSTFQHNLFLQTEPVPAVSEAEDSSLNVPSSVERLFHVIAPSRKARRKSAGNYKHSILPRYVARMRSSKMTKTVRQLVRVLG